MPEAKFFQGLQIHEAWRTHAHAPGLLRAVRNQIATDLAFGSFDRMIVIADRRLDQFRHLRVHRAVGKINDRDRKSTRLNSSHGYISYAVFCLKKKKKSNETSINESYRDRYLPSTSYRALKIRYL